MQSNFLGSSYAPGKYIVNESCKSNIVILLILLAHPNMCAS